MRTADRIAQMGFMLGQTMTPGGQLNNSGELAKPISWAIDSSSGIEARLAIGVLEKLVGLAKFGITPLRVIAA